MGRILIFVMLPLILIIGAGAGALMLGLIPGFGEPPETPEQVAAREAEEKKKKETVPPVFADSPVGSVHLPLEEFVINLRTDRREPVFLLLSLVLEVPTQGTVVQITSAEPKIRDAVIVYLSSLTPEDLNGYDAIQMVRQELWKRISALLDDGVLINLQIAKLTVK